MSGQRVLVTGAGGYLGSQLVAQLATSAGSSIVAHDLRPPRSRLPGVEYAVGDIRSPELGELVRAHAIDTVVHLASVVTPGRGQDRAFLYDVDVNGARNVLRACTDHGVRRIVVSSSGAAYGYHADNPAWITEDQPLRGNEAFAYSHHKRLVEELLAQYRSEHPQLEQVVLRIGTILGPTVRNQITDLFEKPRLLAISGCDSPFVFVADEDVVAIIVRAVEGAPAGIYNVAGDGALTIHDIAARLGKRCRVLPAGLLRGALALLHPLGLTQYGPEQLDFLRYRPVLLNTRLKTGFGYTPRYTSAQVLDLYRASRQPRAHAAA